ncbi:MAG: hypothetical protein GY795_09640 [Desulfobacterales bacterium]|nr:hypothetical protein [Desulfobacterales bacterium]
MYEFDKEINKLKEVMLSADELIEIFRFFFDHLGENPDFMNMGNLTEHPSLNSILREIGKRVLNDDIQITELLLTEIAKHGFIHGKCLLNGRMTSILYFKDIDVGIISLILSFSSPDNRLFRFSGLPMPEREDREDKKDILVSPGTKTIH